MRGVAYAIIAVAAIFVLVLGLSTCSESAERCLTERQFHTIRHKVKVHSHCWQEVHRARRRTAELPAVEPSAPSIPYVLWNNINPLWRQDPEAVFAAWHPEIGALSDPQSGVPVASAPASHVAPEAGAGAMSYVIVAALAALPLFLIGMILRRPPPLVEFEELDRSAVFFARLRDYPDEEPDVVLQYAGRRA
ncbi:MAG: hypothetical protein C5B50_00705 [Verrucomicrobia bacterium]|nr:MAG: hypothetical protein C5B50_00705 [Verrucomicrobiota bacterium]